MYSLELVVEKPKKRKWGDFEVRKTFKVTKDGGTAGVFGYVVQRVEKTTIVNVSDGRVLTTSGDIATFTTQQVQNATQTYYEAFPILNGTTCQGNPSRDRRNCVDDQFQNGALLRYELERGEYYADDDPPTHGRITMVGTCVFFPTDQATATAIYNAIQRPTMPTLIIEGTEWSLSPETPANGLPYRDDFELQGDQQVVHDVVVSWNIKGKTEVNSQIRQQAGRSHRRRRTTRRLRRKSLRVRR